MNEHQPPAGKSDAEIDKVLRTLGPSGVWAASYIAWATSYIAEIKRESHMHFNEAQRLRAILDAATGHVLQYDINADQFSFKPIDRLIYDQLHSLNAKVDRLMTQHEDANAALDSANSKLDSLSADVQTLIAAITAQNGGTPPTPEDWSDIVTKATALAQRIGDADNSVKSATPAAATGAISGKASI